MSNFDTHNLEKSELRTKVPSEHWTTKSPRTPRRKKKRKKRQAQFHPRECCVL